MVDSSDKRDFRRMSVDCPLEFKVNGSGEVYTGKVINLSATGLLILSDQELQVGDVIDVNIQPVKNLTPPLDASAEVLRVDPLESGSYEIGCSITRINPEESTA